MLVEIPISMNEVLIGSLTFKFDDVDQGVGRVRSLKLPDHSQLKKLIEINLATNPERLAITGGHFVPNIGNYSDGVMLVLTNMAKQHNLTFDFSEMPWPQPSEGSLF